MMAFTALNLLLCTIRRFKPLTKLVFRLETYFPCLLRKLPHHCELPLQTTTEAAALAQRKRFSAQGLQVEVNTGRQVKCCLLNAVKLATSDL